MQDLAVFLIEDVFKIPGRRVVVTGIVKKGEISIGMWGDINGIKVRVLDIEAFAKRLTVAKEGERVGLLLDGIKNEDIQANQEIIFSK